MVSWGEHGSGRSVKDKQSVESIIYGIPGLLIFAIALMTIGCLPTSHHFDETMNDPMKVWEIERNIKTEEEKNYWENVKKNREGFPIKIFIQDSVDEELSRQR